MSYLQISLITVENCAFASCVCVLSRMNSGSPNECNPGWSRGRSTGAGAACGRGCMEKMRSRPS